MLEQAHLEGTSTDTDFQQSEHQLPHLASYVYGTWHSSDENYVPFIMPLQVNRFMP